jgi:hypothetical protein
VRGRPERPVTRVRAGRMTCPCSRHPHAAGSVSAGVDPHDASVGASPTTSNEHYLEWHTPARCPCSRTGRPHRRSRRTTLARRTSDRVIAPWRSRSKTGDQQRFAQQLAAIEHMCEAVARWAQRTRALARQYSFGECQRGLSVLETPSRASGTTRDRVGAGYTAYPIVVYPRSRSNPRQAT